MSIIYDSFNSINYYWSIQIKFFAHFDAQLSEINFFSFIFVISSVFFIFSQNQSTCILNMPLRYLDATTVNLS